MSSAGAPLLDRVSRLRSRLGFRIYLVGLCQFVLVALGVVLAAREARRGEPAIETLRVVGDSIAAAAPDPAAVSTAVANAEKLLHTSLALYDERHHLLAGTPRPAAHGGHEPFDATASRPPRFLHEAAGVPVTLADGRVWFLTVSSSHRFMSSARGVAVTVVLVLLVVGVSAWLTARSLARPLARLSAATQAFGAGDLTARADLRRRDELGDVASAFDQMAGRVAAALRAEKELLANVSHELRTPLQRIHIAVELAAEGDAATARESLTEIAEDLAELERIVEDVLSAAQLSLRRQDGGASPLPPLRFAPVDVGTLLERSVGRFRSRYPGRPLREDLRQMTLSLEVDAALMHRAVDNLLDNAHKYSEDDRAEVVLAAWRGARGVVVEIRDHGVGVSADDLPRLFEPFFRADRSRTRGSGGLGLGLPLAKRIIVAHGGTLTMTSAPGEGTTASIELPCEPSPQAAEP